MSASHSGPEGERACAEEIAGLWMSFRGRVWETEVERVLAILGKYRSASEQREPVAWMVEKFQSNGRRVCYWLYGDPIEARARVEEEEQMLWPVGHGNIRVTPLYTSAPASSEPETREQEFVDRDVIVDQYGTRRFHENPIVWYLLQWGRDHGCGMNELAIIDFPDWARREFAQMIGYSVSGYSDLSYVDDAAYERAEARANALRTQAAGPGSEEPR